MHKNMYFIKVSKRDLANQEKFGGDLRAVLWYSAMKDYAKRLGKDKLGYTRVSSATIKQDFGFDRMRVWRYNQDLEKRGLIAVDKASRGGRTWIGFKIL